MTWEPPDFISQYIGCRKLSPFGEENEEQMKKKHARYGLVVVLTLIALSAAAGASTCSTSTLTSYDANGFTCQVGAATASEFGTVLVSAFGGTPSSTNAITVVPTGGMNNPGFNFNANYSASGLLSVESVTIVYELSVPNGQTLTSSSLSLTNPAITGLGTMVAGELLCLNGEFIADICTGGVQVNVGTISGALGNLNAIVTLTLGDQPVTEMGVLKTLTLDGVVLGSASASGLNNSYTIASSPTPEPSTMALLGTGLLGLVSLRKRWLKA